MMQRGEKQGKLLVVFTTSNMAQDYIAGMCWQVRSCRMLCLGWNVKSGHLQRNQCLSVEVGGSWERNSYDTRLSLCQLVLKYKL